MLICDLNETCIFFNDKMPDMPDVAGYLKDKYCRGRYEECARFRIFQEFGREHVPAGLFPNEEFLVAETAEVLRRKLGRQI